MGIMEKMLTKFLPQRILIDKVLVLLYVFFLVILRRLNFIYQRFGTLCLFHLHRQVGVECMEQTERSEMSAYKIQMPGNHPKENIQHTEHGESLKSGKCC
jgi:hypothetical protein